MSLHVERMASEQLGPVNPIPQAQENEATPAVHVPPFMQGFGSQLAAASASPASDSDGNPYEGNPHEVLSTRSESVSREQSTTVQPSIGLGADQNVSGQPRAMHGHRLVLGRARPQDSPGE